MAELFDVPERFCAKGHKITKLQELVERRKDGSLIVTGYVNKSVLICEACAWEASNGEILYVRHRPVRGKKLEKLGQESFLQKVPAKFID